MLKLITDRVLIFPHKESERSEDGIFIPPKARKKVQEGVVVAIGPGRINNKGVQIKPTVKVCDIVIYSQFAGIEYTPKGAPPESGISPAESGKIEKYLIMREEDIELVLE